MASAAPLLEREGAVATLERLAASVQHGAGRLVVIEAPAGMGKTRLTGEVRAMAQRTGLRVLGARGGELEGAFPFGVVRQLFEPLLAMAPGDLRADLLSGPAVHAAPLFDPVQLDASWTRGADPSFVVLHGLYWLAANLAYQHPTVLVIDDLHWADAPSLRWLSYLVARLEGLPLLLVVATRPPEREAVDPALVDTVISGHDAVAVTLEPLGAPSVAALARDLHGFEVDARFCEAIAAATDGNPLFVRALLDGFSREGIPPAVEHLPRVLEPAAGGVGRITARRLARLAPEAARLARAASILGDGVPLHRAARLAALDGQGLDHAVDGLVRVGLLRRREPIEFAHPIVRSAVYEATAPVERSAGHRQAAQLLLDADAVPEQAAAHLLRAAPANDAVVVQVLRDAARRALAQGAAESAVGYLRRALEERPDAATGADVLLELGMAEALVDGPAAAEHLRAARAAIDDPVRRAEVGAALARTLTFTYQVDEAVETYLSDLDALGDRDDALRRRLEAGLAAVTLYEPDRQELAEERFARARTNRRPPDPGGRMLDALLVFRDAWTAACDAPAAAARARAALADGQLLEHDNAGPALVGAGWTLLAADRLGEVVELYDACIAAARRQGSGFAYAGARIFRGQALYVQGELREAEAELREAIDANRAWGIELGRSYPTAYLADTEIALDDLAGAQAAIAESGFGEHLPDNAHTLYLLLARARLRVRQERLDDGLAGLLEVGRRFVSTGGRNPAFFPWRSEAAHVALRLGRREEARRLAHDELALARAWNAPRTLSRALRAAGLAEDGAAGLGLLTEAVTAGGGSGARLEEAAALVELGAALRRANRRAEARERLRDGIDLAHRCGAAALARRGNEELAAAGARPRRAAASGRDTLTASERRVAEAAAAGLSNKAIAQTLFVTVKTVELHLSNAYRKLDIGSRAELARTLGEHPSVAGIAGP